MTLKKYKFKNIEGVIFDLDGVITNTASIHKNAWKKTFDIFLKKNGSKEFKSIDYYRFIDGKPRDEAIKDYLKVKKIDFDNKIVSQISNKKNILFRQILKEKGVKLFSDAKKLLLKIKKKNIKIALASSSKNCSYIVRKSKIYNFFEFIIDGEDLDRKKIKGKPNPKIFVEVIKKLKLSKKNTIIIEDSIEGIKAAYKSNVKFPIAISRNSNIRKLKKNGAKIVLKSLNQIFIN